MGDGSDSDEEFFYYGTPLQDEVPQGQSRDRAPQDPSQTRALPVHQQVRVQCAHAPRCPLDRSPASP
jgi:hypothetical protein